jgi:hypothetical protein
MLKKLMLLTAVILSALALPAKAAFWNNDITMLIMPREAIPLQIAQDISRRYPVLLVSYQQVHGALKLHAWTGGSWVAVSAEDYANGAFFAVRPAHAILVESEKLKAPAELVPNSTWCKTANRLSSTDPRVLLHLLGLYFDFPFSHWDLMARRYGYSLEQINPTLENVHWWNIRHDVVLETREPLDTSTDVNCWYYLETIPAPVIEPILIEEASPILPATEETGATAVEIIAKAPEAPAPAVPAPVIEPAPEPAPVIEPIVDKPVPTIEAAPIAEMKETVDAAAPVPEPAGAIEADPFSAEEIPAAEIVVPQEPKKSWWKLF